MKLRMPAASTLGLFTLCIAMFVVVTGEMSPVGLLPLMSADLRVSPGAVGLLMTGYAAVVALVAAPLTAATGRLPRKGLLLGLLAMFAVTNVAVALAPTYPLVLLARLIGGMAHGVFFAILVGIAVRTAPNLRPGKAIGRVFFGNSVAIVLGVPLVTALATLVGWRISYLVIGGLCAAACALAAAVVPKVHTPAPGGLRALPGVLRIPGVAAVLGITVFICLGHYTVYTYISEFLTQRSGVSLGMVTMLLAVFGVSGLLGTWLAGQGLDHRPRVTLFCAIALVVLAIAMLALFGSHPVMAVIAIGMWGAGFIGLPVCLQHKIAQLAPNATDPASAFYGAGFNVGISGGALIGSLLLGPFGPGLLPVVGVVLVLAGTVIAGLLTVAEIRVERAQPQTDPYTRSMCSRSTSR